MTAIRIWVQVLEAGLRAAGGAVLGVDRVMRGEAERVFLAARPPGHHAEPDTAMGFCLFSSAAIAAEHARQDHGLTRVAWLISMFITATEPRRHSGRMVTCCLPQAIRCRFFPGRGLLLKQVVAICPPAGGNRWRQCCRCLAGLPVAKDRCRKAGADHHFRWLRCPYPRPAGQH